MSRNYGLLAVFVLGVLGVGMVIGYLTPPGDWFAALQKPTYQPPNWLFAPVWTVLYIMIGVVGWRVHQLSPDYGLRKLWWIQLVLNYLWSPSFFGIQNIFVALVVIVALWVVLLGFIGRSWLHDKVSALLMLPLFAWVSFATLLNGSIWFLN